MVEDVFLVACDLADQLTAAGCEVVGPVPSVEQAFQRMDGLVLDGALLDVNLRGERSFPIAEHFATEGIPFIFLTGYDSVTVFPERFRESPRLLKPVDAGVLTEAVANFRRT
ncbi:response regulator [Mesorhizobium sp.]|uniref:response regulator n=1 Tax=Mesorhizobium sp. TaxID=1871066 RepID=UPI0025E939F0|nr:response regulator [Mesorhizobium sp.]